MITPEDITGQDWRCPQLPAAERAAALLAQMTPEEKLHQLGSSWPGSTDAGGEVAPMQETFARAETFEIAVQGGLGHLTRPFGTAPLRSVEGMRRLSNLQKDVVAGNRFGIPAIAHEECLTGFTTWTATVFPTSLAWGATFNPELIGQMAAAIGSDMAAVGVHQGLSPVLDVVRDYRWGRVEETIGEDPHLVGEIGSAYVRGLQSAGIVATLKHFAGYSASRGARNHAPVTVGPREFNDVILPPFRRAVLEGVRSVMNSYADVDGVPPAADRSLLTSLLRDAWGFEGVVVSDYWALPFLHSMHAVAADNDDAGAQGLAAGMDVELPHTVSFGSALLERIDRGELDPALLDQAALRVLTQKAELGLLDPDWTPTEPAEIDLDSPRNREIARRVAHESIVLLENPTALLPLNPEAVLSIAVIGPAADDAGCLFGCYSFPNHVVVAHPGTAIGIEAPTVLASIRTAFPTAAIEYEQGVSITGTDASRIPAAVAAAERADLTLLVVGDRSGMFGHGTSGEGCDAIDLSLPGIQEQLVDAVLEAGSPVILVVISGRPYAIGAAAGRADAALQAFFPGEEGATALTDVLTGLVNPSGHLPVQIPGAASSQPGTYLAPPLALKSDGVSNIDPTPAYPFGWGRSYTTFKLSQNHVSASNVSPNDTVTITTHITNTGPVAGADVVQLYLTDPVSTVTTPVRRLIAFTRATLEAGQSAQVTFQVPLSVAAFTGRDGRRRVEAGQIGFIPASCANDPGHPLWLHIDATSAPLADDAMTTVTTTVTVTTDK